MTIFEINKFQIACFMFKVYTQQLPSYFNDLFIQNSALHSHNTRQSSDYHISYSRTKTRQLSIAIYGAKIWNSLDQNLKSSVTLQNFKYRYKKHLLKSR